MFNKKKSALFGLCSIAVLLYYSQEEILKQDVNNATNLVSLGDEGELDSASLKDDDYILKLNNTGRQMFHSDVILPYFDMRNATSAQVCTSKKLVHSKTAFITGLSPVGNVDKLHHITVFLCEEPGPVQKGQYFKSSTADLWQCLGSDSALKLPTGDVCASRTISRLFGWDKHIREYNFPPNMGVEVGPYFNRYVVVSMHLMGKMANDDRLGIRLHMTGEKPNQLIGTLTMQRRNFEVPPQSTVNANCVIRVPSGIDSAVPFAFHPHTHKQGQLVSVHSVSNSWALIGQAKPRTGQSMHPANPVPLNSGDKLALRCTMRSEQDTSIREGEEAENEMCLLAIYFTYDNKLKKTPKHHSLQYCSRQVKLPFD